MATAAVYPRPATHHRAFHRRWLHRRAGTQDSNHLTNAWGQQVMVGVIREAGIKAD